MNLGEVVASYPEAAKILTEHGLHCVSCFFNKFDTLEDAMTIHSLSDKEIKEILKALNQRLAGSR